METPDSKTTTSPPPQQETDLKKPKMSSTTSEEDDAAITAPGDETNIKKQRYKRRKIAIFFAYCGVGYQGMQKNPGAKTIEGDLEEALFHACAVPENDRGIPKRYDWARSARTDKGVSAVGQVVSGRFYIDPPGLVERLHSNLSPQFRIFGYKRVTGSFNAKKFCDRRRYVYLIPVFALNPCSHRDRESVLASLGSGSELVKCLECSERGRKVVGALGKRSFESKSDVSPTEIRSNDKDTTLKPEIKEEVSALLDNGDGVIRNFESVNEIKVLRNEDSVTTESGISSNSEDANANPEIKDEIMVSIEKGDDKNTKSEEEAINGSGFCYEEKEKERFNRILNYYVGSHNFHNFTTRTKAEDPSARRFIVSFDAKTIVTVEGIEFVKCEVVGQSFMLHQIRKMIGAAVAIMRNCASESLIQTALQKDVNITVPTAPEVGLYLDECFFTSYNQKWKDSHEELSMKDYEEEAEEFKMKHIYSHIAATEHKEGSVALWLHSLNHRNYPDLQVCGNGDNITSEDNNGKESTTVENMAESTAL
ncbi:PSEUDOURIDYLATE SYNTHASE [Salix viminalis]|uniref:PSEUDOURIDYLATE SYNTHASE n=1 Tax=Salix viminalis TaxID=40686 RepID=A0A9Q0UU39_SALVM|nr:PSEUDOURIDYLATE SYNTHASE [Salix viminalis]